MADLEIIALDTTVPKLTAPQLGDRYYAPRTMVFKTSDSTTPSIAIPHGSAPSTPVDGDFWTTAASLVGRINGSTRTFIHDGNPTTLASDISQAEAEAGTATTRRWFTAQRVAQAVRGGILTGLTTATNAVITATDTVLSALGKLQKQITDHTDATAAHGAIGAVVGTTNTQTLTNKTLTAAVLGGTTNVSGGQLKFPATQSPSSDANTLDDYKEGTFNCSYGTFSSISGSWGQAVCTYTKIGRHVFVNAQISGSGMGVNTNGYIQFTGMPFASAINGAGSWGSTSISSQIAGTVVVTASEFWLYASNNNNTTGSIWLSFHFSV